MPNLTHPPGMTSQDSETKVTDITYLQGSGGEKVRRGQRSLPPHVVMGCCAIWYCLGGEDCVWSPWPGNLKRPFWNSRPVLWVLSGKGPKFRARGRMNLASPEHHGATLAQSGSFTIWTVKTVEAVGRDDKDSHTPGPIPSQFFSSETGPVWQVQSMECNEIWNLIIVILNWQKVAKLFL